MLKAAPVLLAGLVTMGGWATVTIRELPDYFVAGAQYTIEFQVRQHGRKPLSGLKPQLVVGSSSIAAIPRPGEGNYAATFTVPNTDRLSLTIQSGWGASEVRLYPERVLARGVTPPALPAAERGEMLFLAKGCNMCHANSDLADGLDRNSITVGPALGGRHLAREYTIQKMKNPNSQIMPDLGLSDAEAAAIAAFLSGDRAGAAGGGR
jgi:mono/diheme cytochrome c family protein